MVLNRAEFLATIIFLGCKADECPKSLRSVISVVWRFLDIQIAEKYLESRYAEFKTIVVKKEQEILRILGFNTTVDHPHKYLLNFARYFMKSKIYQINMFYRSLNISCEVVNVSWSCLNDFMIIREFVLFKPYEISIACIYFGIHSIQKLHHNSQTELTSSDHEFLASKWWNQFGVNDSILCSILSLIVKYYQN